MSRKKRNQLLKIPNNIKIYKTRGGFSENILLISITSIRSSSSSTRKKIKKIRNKNLKKKLGSLKKNTSRFRKRGRRKDWRDQGNCKNNLMRFIKNRTKEEKKSKKFQNPKLSRKKKKMLLISNLYHFDLFRLKAMFKKPRKNLKPLRVRRRKTPPPPKNNQQRPHWKKLGTKKEWLPLKLNLPLRG